MENQANPEQGTGQHVDTYWYLNIKWKVFHLENWLNIIRARFMVAFILWTLSYRVMAPKSHQVLLFILRLMYYYIFFTFCQTHSVSVIIVWKNEKSLRFAYVTGHQNWSIICWLRIRMSARGFLEYFIWMPLLPCFRFVSIRIRPRHHLSPPFKTTIGAPWMRHLCQLLLALAQLNTKRKLMWRKEN